MKRLAANHWIFILLLLNFVMMGLLSIDRQRDIAHTDQTLFLDSAYKYRDANPLLRLLPPLHMSRDSYHRTHPLMRYILYPLAGDVKAFYPKAKLMTLACGLSCLIVLYWAMGSLYGKTAGIVAVCLTSFNWVFLKMSTQISAEPILLTMLVAWLYYSARSLEESRRTGAGIHRNWILAGVFSGLAYLAKPSAVILPVLFLVAAVIKGRRSLTFLKLGAFLLSFFIIISPLMIANVQHGRFPIFNENFYKLIQWEGEHPSQDLDGPPMQEGLTRHWNKYGGIYLAGAGSFFIHLADAVAPRLWLPSSDESGSVWRFPASTTWILFILVTMVLFLAFPARDRMKWMTSTFFLLYTLCLIPPAKLNPSPRFFLPDVMILYIMFSAVVGQMLDRRTGVSERRLRSLRFTATLVIALLSIGSIFYHLSTKGIPNPMTSFDRATECFDEWKSTVPSDSHNEIRIAAYRLEFDLLCLLLRNTDGFAPIPIPNAIESKEDLQTFLREKDTDYLFVTMGSVWYHPLFSRLRPNTGYNVAEFCRTEMDMLELYQPENSRCTWLAVCSVEK